MTDVCQQFICSFQNIVFHQFFKIFVLSYEYSLLLRLIILLSHKKIHGVSKVISVYKRGNISARKIVSLSENKNHCSMHT